MSSLLAHSQALLRQPRSNKLTMAKPSSSQILAVNKHHCGVTFVCASDFCCLSLVLTWVSLKQQLLLSVFGLRCLRHVSLSVSISNVWFLFLRHLQLKRNDGVLCSSIQCRLDYHWRILLSVGSFLSPSVPLSQKCILDLIVQPHRFDLFYGYGCRPATYPCCHHISYHDTPASANCWNGYLRL